MLSDRISDFRATVKGNINSASTSQNKRDSPKGAKSPLVAAPAARCSRRGEAAFGLRGWAACCWGKNHRQTSTFCLRRRSIRSSATAPQRSLQPHLVPILPPEWRKQFGSTEVTDRQGRTAVSKRVYRQLQACICVRGHVAHICFLCIVRMWWKNAA